MASDVVNDGMVSVASVAGEVSGPRRIGAAEFGSTFATNVAIQACTLVQAIILARLLGPTGRGQLAAAILWPTVFAAVGGLGVAVALARRSARASELARLRRTALSLTLGTGAIATACCALALPWLMADVDAVSRAAAWYFLPYILFNHVALGMIAIDQGAGRFRAYNLARLVLNPVYVVLIVGLWLAGTRDVHWYVVGLMIANGVVAVTRVAAAARHHSLIGPMEPVLTVAREAVPFGAAGFLSPFLQSADKALLLYLLGTTELGIYAVAATAASVISSLATSAGAVSFGITAQEAELGGAFPRVARMFRVTAWIWLIAGACLAAAIPVLLPLIYGAAFAPAVWPAILLIPAAALAGQASILEESMRAAGRAFLGLEARLAGMAVFLVIGWLLAEPWGVIGVALAFVAAQSIVLLVMLCAARWHFAKPTWASLLPRGADLRDLLLGVQTHARTFGRLAAK